VNNNYGLPRGSTNNNRQNNNRNNQSTRAEVIYNNSTVQWGDLGHSQHFSGFYIFSDFLLLGPHTNWSLLVFRKFPKFKNFEHPNISAPRQTEIWSLDNLSNTTKIFHFERHVTCTTTKLHILQFSRKMAKNGRSSRFFFMTKTIFLGSRWNISTKETALETLLKFWNFSKIFMVIALLVQGR
jgi:hypothetical protein